MGLHVLVVEDDTHTARLVGTIVNGGNDIAMTHVARLQDALDALQSLSVDAILLDLALPDSTGFETFSRVHAAARQAAVIVLARAGNEEIAARALREGAHDSLLKGDFDPPLLARTIRHAIERRRFEAELTRSEARYRTLIDGSIQGIAIHRHGIILLANQALAQLLGAASADELVGTEIWTYIAAEDRPLVALRMRLREQGQPVPPQYEFRAVRRDGSAMWLEAVVSTIMWEGDPAVLATLVDRTKRHQAEAALRESEALFRQLADNIKEALIILELPDYKALYLSRVWEEMWGLRIEDAYRDPQHWLKSVHPDDRQLVPSLNAAIERGEPITQAFRLVRPDGSRRWVRTRLVPVRNDEGRVYRAVGLVEDITEARHTEEQLLLAQKMGSIGRLVSGVAHDFNNQLVVVLGYAELLLEQLGPDDPAGEDVRQIRAAAHSAGALTRHLLALGRRQILEPEVIDLNHVLRQLETLLRRVLGEDVGLSLQLTTPLAPVNADPGQIEQIIMNLAVNARDAMSAGGRLTIETRNAALDEAFVAQHPGTTVGRHAMMTVSDTGAGMDEATRNQLFDPFLTAKEDGRGSGLGLSTVHAIVKQSGGFITVASEPDQGTTFTIYLPAVEGEPAAVAAGPEPRSLSGTETVLVVEDQPEVRVVIRETLQRHGYTVLEAENASDAFARARGHDGPVHLLLADVVLAGMSGPMVAEALAAKWPSLRTVFMSGYGDQVVVRHGVVASGMRFLRKPFSGESLLQEIRDALDA
jgi:PAS domain S-box-containing protein